MSEPKEDTRTSRTDDPQRQGARRQSGAWRTATPNSSRVSLIDRGISWLERRRDAIRDQFEEGSLRGQRLRGWAEKLLIRAVTGVVYVVAIVVCLYFGPWTTALLIAAMSWLCCSEYFRMMRKAGRMPNEVVGLGVALAYPFAPLLPIPNPIMVISAVLLVSCAAWYVATPRANVADVAVTAFGPLYTSLTYSTVVFLRASNAGWTGFFLTLGIMASVWMNDTCAYLVGSRFGKHKLAAHISPNKSVEGFWGGIVASVAVWLVMGFLHVAGMSVSLALVAGVSVSFIAVVGDLFESRIKRGVGVKDSGDILPGHGGLLDRSDSMIFGALVAYTILHLGGIL